MTTYEISVWEDYYDNELGRYCERRLAIIGQSNMNNSGVVMESQSRARDPKLVNNVNGTNTFSFTMYYSYIDNETGETVYNPFIPLLINERKIKVFWHDDWYDFVIKDIKRSSDKKTVTYTCKDLFINELSKNGYNIEFSDELQNNMGNISDLAEKVVEGTDWKVAPSSDIIEAWQEEAVYELRVEESSGIFTTLEEGSCTFSQNDFCLLYYSVVQEMIERAKDNKPFVFQIINFGEHPNITFDQDTIVVSNGSHINIKNMFCTEIGTASGDNWIEFKISQGTGNGSPYIKFWLEYNISSNYRAKRSVYKQLSTIDKKLNKVVDLYTKYSSYQLKSNTSTSITVKSYYIKNGTEDVVIPRGTICEIDAKTWLDTDSECLELEFIQNDELVHVDIIKNDNNNEIIFFSDNGGDDLRLKKGNETTGSSAFFRKSDNSNIKLSEMQPNSKPQEVYKYTHTEFDDYTTIQNVIINGEKFNNTQGWRANQLNSNLYEELILEWEPKYSVASGNNPKYLYTTLKATPDSTRSIQLINLGLETNYSAFNNRIDVGEQYIFEYEGTVSPTNIYIGKCDVDLNGVYSYTNNSQNSYFSCEKVGSTNQWICTCIKAIQPSELEANFVIGIVLEYTSVTEVEILKVLFYRLVQYYKTIDNTTELTRVYPGQVANLQLKKTVSYYYYPENSAESISDLQPICVDIEYSSPGVSQIKSSDFQFTPKTNLNNGKYESINSIIKSNSNRFNLLQDLAEKFQCWVRFKIEHNMNTGEILYDNINQRYCKDIVFKQDIGEDTGIIFSKGIDLKTLSQNYNSDQLVTKVIVPKNDLDVAENGFCSIQRSKLNPSRESYILNFDYYISQGLIDREQLYNDLYNEELRTLVVNNESYDLPKGYLPALRELNQKYDEAYNNYNENYNFKIKVASSQKAYYEDYYASIEERRKKQDEFRSYTGHVWGGASDNYLYNAYQFRRSGETEPFCIFTGEKWIGEPLSDEIDNIIVEYGFYRDDNFNSRGSLVIDTSYLYVDLNPYHYSGIFFDNLTNEYGFLLTYTDGAPRLFPTKKVNIRNAYVQQSISYPSSEELQNKNIVGLAQTIFQLNSKINSLYELTNQYNEGTYDILLQQLDEKLEIWQQEANKYLSFKNKIDDDFWYKYGRFIQEGTWTDSQYYDDNLYYIAAENVLRTSAKPQFKFDINIISLESLEDFKLKRIKVGDIGSVEDPEFLGMIMNGLQVVQPRREKIIISEIAFNLDSPQKDSIKVQNYKTRFEDLFQRITASTESLKAQEGSFARAANQFTDDGAIKQQVIQDALTLGASSLNFASTNNTVVKDGTGITIIDTINRNRQLKLSSSGIYMTEDGGRYWKPVLDSDGIKPTSINSGTINPQVIKIENAFNDSKAFRWDMDGIAAYTDVSDTNHNYVKLNEQGITMTHGTTSPAVTSTSSWADYLANDDVKVRIDRASGNVKIKGDIYADRGYFNGTVNATDGIFNGTINATNGNFTGVVNATGGIFSNTIEMGANFIFRRCPIIDEAEYVSGLPAGYYKLKIIDNLSLTNEENHVKIVSRDTLQQAHLYIGSEEKEIILYKYQDGIYNYKTNTGIFKDASGSQIDEDELKNYKVLCRAEETEFEFESLPDPNDPNLQDPTFYNHTDRISWTKKTSTNNKAFQLRIFNADSDPVIDFASLTTALTKYKYVYFWTYGLGDTTLSESDKKIIYEFECNSSNVILDSTNHLTFTIPKNNCPKFGYCKQVNGVWQYRVEPETVTHHTPVPNCKYVFYRQATPTPAQKIDTDFTPIDGICFCNRKCNIGDNVTDIYTDALVMAINGNPYADSYFEPYTLSFDNLYDDNQKKIINIGRYGQDIAIYGTNYRIEDAKISGNCSFNDCSSFNTCTIDCGTWDPPITS